MQQGERIAKTSPEETDMGHRTPEPDEPVVIDCDECALQATAACEDCVITFLCGADAATPVVVDLAEARAMRLLDFRDA